MKRKSESIVRHPELGLFACNRRARRRLKAANIPHTEVKDLPLQKVGPVYYRGEQDFEVQYVRAVKPKVAPVTT